MAERFTAYVLQNPEGAIYVGYTADLERRLQQHNQGRGSRFTRQHTAPWTLIRVAHSATREEARTNEYNWHKAYSDAQHAPLGPTTTMSEAKARRIARSIKA